MQESDELDNVMQELKRVIEKEAIEKYERGRQEQEDANYADECHRRRWDEEHNPMPPL